MGNWSFARVFAPLALIAAIVGVIVVVQAARPQTEDDSRTARTTQTSRQRRGARPRSRVYVVRAGDSLTVIAERTGVPLDRIERLNPDVDTQTLSVGQRLRLTR